jgi:hypothetical protein
MRPLFAHSRTATATGFGSIFGAAPRSRCVNVVSGLAK